MRKYYSLIKQTFSNWMEHKALRLGAALAYYAVFSIPPLLLIVISVIGLVYADAGSRVQQQMGILMGEEAAEAMMMVQQKGVTGNWIGVLIGVAILLIGASGVFGELQDAMNTIWEVKAKPSVGWMALVWERLVSFTMVLSVAFLLLVSLVVSAAVAALGAYVTPMLPGGDALARVLDIALSVGVTTMLFALIYKYVPDVKLSWRDVGIGAFVTAILFSVGKFLIGLYLGQSNVGSAYGAAGSLVIILTWVYYSSLILFLGAEFTQVYARSSRPRIEPEENAMPADEPTRDRSGIRRVS